MDDYKAKIMAVNELIHEIFMANSDSGMAVLMNISFRATTV